MLSVTIQVTRTPTSLEQIHHIAIRNTGTTLRGADVYEAWIDGVKIRQDFRHFPEHGALVLLQQILNYEFPEYNYPDYNQGE